MIHNLRTGTTWRRRSVLCWLAAPLLIVSVALAQDERAPGKHPPQDGAWTEFRSWAYCFVMPGIDNTDVNTNRH